MDIGKTGSIFIWGLEEYAAGNEMFLTLTFKDPVNYKKFFDSYKKLILDHPELQLQWIFKKEDNVFQWESFSSDRINDLLQKESRVVEARYTRREVFRQSSYTNERLPLYYYPVDDIMVIVAANHIFSNGSGFLAWIERLLLYYNSENLNIINTTGDSSFYTHGIKDNIKQGRLTGALSGFRAVLYYLLFIMRYMKNAEKTTVDLTHGKEPLKNKNGYSVKTFHCNESETLKIIEEAGKADVSVTEYFCSLIIETFFDCYPKQQRILAAIPSDLRNKITGASPYTPGNYTASLFLQVFRGKPVLKQVHDSWEWLKKNVPYGMAKVVSFIFKDQVKIFQQVKEQSKMPVSDRAPFENFTFVLSSIGEIKSSEIRKTLKSITGNTKTQTIFISMGTMGGKLSLEASVSNDLFDSNEVFRILDKVFEKITPSRLLSNQNIMTSLLRS